MPNGKTAYHYFRRWKLGGIWDRAINHLRKQARQAINREEEPSATIINNQSIKTSPIRGIERGFDARKKIWGCKRHLLVDTQGFVLAVNVRTAGLSDWQGAKELLGPQAGAFPRIRHLFADHDYTGPLIEWIKEHLRWTTEIVPKATNDSHQQWVLIDDQPVLQRKPKGGFQVQRKR